MSTTHPTPPTARATREGIVHGMFQLPDAAARLRTRGAAVHAVLCLQHADAVGGATPLLDALAEHATVTVVSTGRPRLPGHVAHVELDDDDALAAELSLVLCSRDGGVALVAHELDGAVVHGDAAATFAWEAVHGRRDALAHARRVVRELGARLDPGCSAALQAAVAAMARADDDVEQPGNAELCAAVTQVDASRFAAA